MNSQFDGGATNADILEDWLLQVFKATKQSQDKKEQASNLSLSYETDVTVNLTTFIELLTTMTMAQKINKSGWMDPSGDWGQDGGYDTPRMQQTGQKQGNTGNWGLQKGELPKLLRIVFSQENSVPGSGKPTAMK